MSIYSIIMFVLTAAFLIYAGITALTKNITVPYNRSASVRGTTKQYATQFSKLIALLTIAPFVSGIVGLFENLIIVAIIVLVVLFIGLLILGIKTIMKDVI